MRGSADEAERSGDYRSASGDAAPIKTRDERSGLGACTGDSGGPAFVESGGRYAVIGVVSWSTGPGGTEGCGGMTGVTPLSLHRGWIVEQARKMGSALK
jgi:secreted trypsin-like serine protease